MNHRELDAWVELGEMMQPCSVAECTVRVLHPSGVCSEHRMDLIDIDLSELLGRSQVCLGCERRVFASQWMEHSQECILLEAIVELALTQRLDHLGPEGRD